MSAGGPDGFYKFFQAKKSLAIAVARLVFVGAAGVAGRATGQGGAGLVFPSRGRSRPVRLERVARLDAP
jgi:hypothetical protein